MEKMKPGPKSKLPKGVAEGLKRTLATVEKGKPGSIQETAAHWGQTLETVRAFAQTNRQEIDDLRGAVSRGCFTLAGQVADSISQDLSDPDKMKDTPLRDKAQAVEKLVNAGTTSADGHKPSIQINWPEIRLNKASLEARDREMKRANGREVA